MRTALIILWAAAIVLSIVAFIVVFYPSGSYQPVVEEGPGTVSFSNLPTSTPTSSLANAASGTALSGAAAASSSSLSSLPIGTFGSNYTSPYPITWNDGGASFAVTGAVWNGNQLALSLSIQMGPSPACVPIDLRLVANESGALQAPSSPAGPNFIFPDTQTCNGSPEATYSQTVTFTIDPSIPWPLLLTTGGAANTFFNIATSTSGGVDIALPGNSG